MLYVVFALFFVPVAADRDPNFMAVLFGIDQNYSYIVGDTTVCYGADMCIAGICQVYTEFAVGVMMYSFGSCDISGSYKGELDMFIVGADSNMLWVNATETECFDQKSCFSYACNTQDNIPIVKSTFMIPLAIDC